MAHFAELGENNIVLRVIVVSNKDTSDINGTEIESIGAEFCRSLLGGTWKQTSYNGNFRKRYAGIGYTYNSNLDAFIPPQPYPSWTLDNELADWVAPTPVPVEEGKSFRWNESTLSWDEIVPE
jgi:hypothetical protein